MNVDLAGFRHQVHDAGFTKAEFPDSLSHLIKPDPDAGYCDSLAAILHAGIDEEGRFTRRFVHVQR